MPILTPQNIVDALHKADKELDELVTQFVWFKAQKEWWEGQLEYKLARSKVLDTGAATKSKEAAIKWVRENEIVKVSWLGGMLMSLHDFVQYCSTSFDLIAKRYNALETHIMILTVVNKNVMQDYTRS
ncbi:hypothetical protein EniyanLRS_68 [Mycobacterium phage EniyanLRS]|uniref:Uncharacterized protein n=1 Tax=Mycobacterium phage EniyanLRS TaxID=1933770 RepID=A0A2I2MPG8_9CAUD|nr:hypothetical protein EniyanLRS_68 [Mycobacterium phage EniyanLRS]